MSLPALPRRRAVPPLCYPHPRPRCCLPACLPACRRAGAGQPCGHQQQPPRGADQALLPPPAGGELGGAGRGPRGTGGLLFAQGTHRSHSGPSNNAVPAGLTHMQHLHTTAHPHPRLQPRPASLPLAPPLTRRLCSCAAMWTRGWGASAAATSAPQCWRRRVRGRSVRIVEQSEAGLGSRE